MYFFILFFSIAHLVWSVGKWSVGMLVLYLMLLYLQLVHTNLSFLQSLTLWFSEHLMHTAWFVHLYTLCPYLPQLKRGLMFIKSYDLQYWCPTNILFLLSLTCFKGQLVLPIGLLLFCYVNWHMCVLFCLCSIGV